jgi:hypothetical protein
VPSSRASTAPRATCPQVEGVLGLCDSPAAPAPAPASGGVRTASRPQPR